MVKFPVYSVLLPTGTDLFSCAPIKNVARLQSETIVIRVLHLSSVAFLHFRFAE
jgi:hypothetical protein